MPYQLIHGSAHSLPQIPDKSVNLICTSPPYFGLRSYSGDQAIEWPTVEYSPMAGLAPIRVQGCEPGCAHEWADGPRSTQRLRNGTESSNIGGGPRAGGVLLNPTQGAYCIHCGGWRGGLGLEVSVESYIGHLILCLKEWYRILRDDGTCWVNLGSSYANKQDQMIPSRFALAAQAEGWFLRSAIVWAKGVSFIPHYAGSCMPESVQDRPTQSYEMVYMLAKSPSYYYDAEAVKEQGSGKSAGNKSYKYNGIPGHETKQGILSVSDVEWNSRQLRNVWAISPRGYAGAHFACWPEALVTPMIKAGTSQYGVCAKCGSPYKRVVESSRIDELEPSNNLKAQSEAVFSRGGNQAKFGRVGHYRSETTGWIPSCACYGVPIPARIDFPDMPEDAIEPSRCDECDGIGHISTLPMLAALGIEQDRLCETCLGTGHIAANDAWLQWKAECDQIQRDRLRLLDAIKELDLPVTSATVLDPFSGSGTTGKACLKLGRFYIGVDISREYLEDLSPERMSNVQMELAL